MPVKSYDVPLLLRLWNDQNLRTDEVAMRLGISTSFLWRAAAHHHLPPRPAWRDRSDNDAPSDAEDMLSGESLALSPWVRSRIEQLRLGMPARA